MLPIPLHARSHQSLGFGTASVEALAERAARLGAPAVGLTDLETLAAQFRFHDACADAGIKPISGVELRSGYGRRSTGGAQGRLVLLARDARGYGNLCRVVSRRRTQRAENAHEPLASLEGDTEGLFLLTDDVSLLERLVGSDAVDAASLRLLLVRPAPERSERAVHDAAAAWRVPLVADLDPAVLDRADQPLHHLLVAIRHGVDVAELRRAGSGPAAPNAFDADALRQFEDVPEAVRETHHIAEACSLDLRARRRVPPRLPGLDAAQAAVELKGRCERVLEEARGAHRLLGPHYDARLAAELDTIGGLGFDDYLLAVAEIVRGARAIGVETAGRGSAAGSLVAHLLGITEIDPVERDLLFERFLHEQRSGPPDIDLDVASVGREALKHWVVRRFGRARVAGVAAYGTFRARSAVRAGLAGLGIAPAEVERTVRRVDPGDASGKEEAEIVERTLARSRLPAVRRAAPLVARLVGLPSHLSAHPAGLIIGDGPLEALTPLERAPNGTVVTQYDLRAVERAGFLKIDLLGNHFLSELQTTRRHAPSLGEIPRDDARTWRTLDAADTIGCFQVESPPVRAALRRLPVGSFRELVAALAVVRPGAAAGASKERYIRRARGEEPWRALELLGDGPVRDHRLHERLARSFGVLLYDEDIIRLLAGVGGMSPASADALRAAIVAAGDSPPELERLGAGFMAGAVDAGASRRTAQRAWQAATRFASYSFAEAHAASYAALAWKAAWLRTHLPAAFGAALIDHHRALYPLRTTAAAVARWGVTLLPPSVMRSDLASSLEPSSLGPETVGVVRVGLGAVKGLTGRTAGDLVRRGPFRDLGHLIERARPSKRELRALLLSGACDELPPLSPGGYPFVHEVVLEGVRGEAPPEALREVLERIERLPGTGDEAERLGAYQRLVRVRNEIAFLDMHLSDHPMRLLRDEADRLGCLRSREVAARARGHVRLAAVLAAARRVPTSQGDMRFLTLEDEEGLVEALLPPEANRRLGERLATPGPYLIEGAIREGDPHLEITDLSPFHERRDGRLTAP